MSSLPASPEETEQLITVLTRNNIEIINKITVEEYENWSKEDILRHKRRYKQQQNRINNGKLINKYTYIYII